MKRLWAMLVAEQFPTARVIGFSTIQRLNVPLNCEFRVGDLRDDIQDFPDNSVDLCTQGSVTVNLANTSTDSSVSMLRRINGPSMYINDVFRILKPGNRCAQWGEICQIHVPQLPR